MALLAAEAEAKLVAERVAAAEQRSAGEIVVAVVRRSAEYGGERASASLLLTLSVALAVYHFVPAVPEVWVLCGQAPVALALWWLSGLPAPLRYVVPRAIQHEAVHARAQQLFLQLGVTETKQRSGVLLLLSESERRVELLADRGIHERVGAERWQSLVQAVSAAIRDGNAAQGVCAAVDSIGEALAQHFPREAGDTNELPDAVRQI
jgi:putative membrane protein